MWIRDLGDAVLDRLRQDRRCEVARGQKSRPYNKLEGIEEHKIHVEVIVEKKRTRGAVAEVITGIPRFVMILADVRTPLTCSALRLKSNN